MSELDIWREINALKAAQDRLTAVESFDYGWRSKNALMNGDFTIAQRQVPGTLTTYSPAANARLYSADRWAISDENNSTQFQRISSFGAVETGLSAGFYGKFKKITNAGKVFISQPIEGVDMAHLRGRVVRVQAKMRFTIAAAMTVRLGLIQLTNAGVVNTIPAAYITAWGVAGTDPTLGANLAYITPTLVDGGTISGSAATLVLTAAWVRYSATFTVPIDAQNLIVAVWSNGQLAINDELNMTECGLYDGIELRDWMPVSSNLLVPALQRYYYKTFPQATAPATNAGLAGAFRFIAGKAGALAEFGHLRFPVQMLTTAPTVTAYNPSAANNQVRDETGAVDCAATAFFGTTADETVITATGNAATAVGNRLAVHATAEAEL